MLASNKLFPYPELHQMEYDKETGEWHCLECKRRGSIEKGIIFPGDKYATHVAKIDLEAYGLTVTWLLD